MAYPKGIIRGPMSWSVVEVRRHDTFLAGRFTCRQDAYSFAIHELEHAASSSKIYYDIYFRGCFRRRIE